MFNYFRGYCILIWLMATGTYVSFVQGDIMVFSAKSRNEIEQQFKDAPARFGETIPLEGIRGLIVYANPPTACELIAEPPDRPIYEGFIWIVLIARYNCSFELKVRMAEKAGYGAAIIHNVGSNELEPMSAKQSLGITIPSVFVGENTGRYLNYNYLYNSSYYVLIDNDMPFNINTHLLLPFAIVVGICFLVMVIFMVVRCIKDRRRQRRHRLPNSSLKKIPTHKYTKGDPYETCAICLDDYIEGEKLRVLPCAHAYHTKCIDPWLTKNKRVCPVCKRKVFAADERVITDSESDSDADDSTPLLRDMLSTRGGTFAQQRENPFSRARRAQQLNDSTAASGSEDVNYSRTVYPEMLSQRRESNASSQDSTSSSDLYRSTPSDHEHDVTDFLVSDNHSINGGLVDCERSTSSTKPHTVLLSNNGAEEQPSTVVCVTTSQKSINQVDTEDTDSRNDIVV